MVTEKEELKINAGDFDEDVENSPEFNEKFLHAAQKFIAKSNPELIELMEKLKQ